MSPEERNVLTSTVADVASTAPRETNRSWWSSPVAALLFVCAFAATFTWTTRVSEKAIERPETASLQEQQPDPVQQVELHAFRDSHPETSFKAEPPLAADDLFVRASPSVFLVTVEDRKGRVVSSGSGFLVDKKGLIATNYHVIEHGHSAHVELSNKKKLLVAGVAAHNKHADIAILSVPFQFEVPPLALAMTEPTIGARVFAIGNPLGLSNTLSDGLVSGRREDTNSDVIQTTAPISPGSSGGPLLGTDGKVIGVVTSMVKGGQNLNFAVPASQVSQLLTLAREARTLASFPVDPKGEATAHVSRANKLLFEMNRPDEALAELDEAIHLDAYSSSAYGLRGLAYICKADYNRAIRDLDEAIRLNPKSSDAFNNRGNAWKRKGELDNAIADFTEAIRIDPTDSAALFNRGHVRRSRNEHEEAIRDFTEVIRLDPTSENYATRAGVWVSFKNFDKAIEDFDEAIRRDSKNAFAFLGRGCAWAGKKDFSRARKDWDTAERLDPMIRKN